MIPTKPRESRRVKSLKMPKNLERLYKEGKCRDCAVVVTRMDFAKILGKFTKVKIQYESTSTPKGKQKSHVTRPNSSVRLKNSENGMVLLHKNTDHINPVKQYPKKSKRTEAPTRPNILRENNVLKKFVLKDKNSNYDNQIGNTTFSLKKYGIVFEDPLVNRNNNDNISKITLTDLLPQIDENILPSDEWCIDYFPKSEEPKDDKVYDRIAAELEDLMFNDKPKAVEQADVTENKVDEFPSIMDILNDNSSGNKPTDQNNSLDFKPNLESNDVEAILLGKSNVTSESISTSMDVDNPDMRHLIRDVYQLNDTQETGNDEANKSTEVTPLEEIENPQSPSILDEALQKGIEEHLPLISTNTNVLQENLPDTIESTNTTTKTGSKVTQTKVNDNSDLKINKKEKNPLASIAGITHVVFKKTRNGTCYKSVTCPKNLKYTIELSDKSVEFLGAPKFISNLEDLQVLLQIVNETELDSLYVLH